MITYRTPRTDAYAQARFAAATRRPAILPVQNKANFPNQSLGNFKTCMPIYDVKSPVVS